MRENRKVRRVCRVLDTTAAVLAACGITAAALLDAYIVPAGIALVSCLGAACGLAHYAAGVRAYARRRRAIR